MLDNMNLLERKVFQSYWDDGLLDLFAAIGIFLIGVSWLRDFPVGAVFVPALLVPFWNPVRRKVIEPRLGLVEFTEARERRNQRLLKLVMYIGIAVLILAIELYFVRDSLPVEPTVALIAGLPAFLLALLAIITAALIGSARFVAYALILVTTGVGGALLDWGPGKILAVVGGIMFVIAGCLLIQFIRANPPGESA
jgi:hypothetical protein